VSAPARKVTSPPPVERRTPGRRAGAEPHGRAKPVHGAEQPPRDGAHPATTAPRRKQHRLGFAVFAFSLVGSMVLGIVVLHALLAQQSFRIAEAGRSIDELGVERLELLRAQATLSAPGRIADWAFRHDMRLPDDIRILRAPEGSGDPSGAVTRSSDATDEAAPRSYTARASASAEDG